MENFSTTQATNITSFVGIAVMILNHFHINIAGEELTALIGALIAAAGVISNWLNRYKEGDLTLGGFRK